MKYGDGFSIFGIPILSVEHDPLKLFGQAAEFIFVFGFLDAVQTEMQRPLGSAECLGVHSLALESLFPWGHVCIIRGRSGVENYVNGQVVGYFEI
jgi:hypothetical protein